MTSTPTNRAPLRSARPRPARRRKYLPPQHGAWAMLFVPFLVALVCAGFAWLQIPLLAAWIAGYLLSYYAFLAIKTRRISRVRPQLALYTALAVPAGLVVVVVRPGLLVFAPAYVVLLGVNAWYAWHRSDRALVNDLASVVECCLMVSIGAAAAGVAPMAVLGPFLVVLAYFVGTVLFVKTMIRERGNLAFLRGSVAFHAAAAVAAGFVAWPLVALFGWFLARAAWLPHRAMTPQRVGFVEIANCAALLVVMAVALPAS